MLQNRSKQIFILLILLSINSISYGQVVNIENKRIYDDTSGVSGSIDANLSAMKVKDLLVNVFFRPKIQYKTRKHYFLLLSDLLYSKGSSNVFANSGMSHFRYAYRIKGPLKWESYAQIQYNILLDQRVRTLAGTGLRLKCIDNKGVKFFLGTSTFYEYEKLETSKITNQNIRWSNYVSWFMDRNPNLSFSGVIYYQPVIDNFKDYRIMGQYTMSFHFTKRTDFRFEVTHFYDSKPPIGIVNSTFNSSFGVRVKLGE